MDATTAPKLILHLGLGSFHRAHQAVYLQRLIDQGDTAWSIAGGNLRPDMVETVAALQAQGGAYTLETVTPAGERHYERITAIRKIIPYEPSLAGLIDVGADPATRIISFTVTEAGYYLGSDHRLDTRHADVASDLAGTTRVTIYGALAAILDERRQRGSGPVTLLNCDNLRSNGERFHAGFIDFLTRRGNDALLAWVQTSTTAPNAMVDRITPRPLADVAARVKAATGVDDRAALMGEAFIQWVVEDRFIAGRPAWENAGAEMVSSVLPFEEAKIRILNSTHSCFAWAGTLIGLAYIHEGVTVPAIRKMAFDYVTDCVIPSLHESQDPYPLDLDAYRDIVIDRFSNPWLQDTNQRVAADGFSKIPGFLWPTFHECLAAGRSIASIAVLPALFFEFLGRWHRGELAYDYQDQGMDPASAHAFFAAADPLGAFCHDPVLWGPLAGDARLLAAIRAGHRQVLALFVNPGSSGGPASASSAATPGQAPTARAAERGTAATFDSRSTGAGPADAHGAGRLAGQHALVTGAGGGIGLAVVEAYLAEGARCTAVDLAPAAPDDLQALLRNHPETLQYVAADVVRADSIGAMMTAATRRFGTVGVLFNNAAVFDLAPLLEATEASYQRIFDVNVKGLFFVMQAVLKQMVATGVAGSVINLASQAGRRGEALVAHYCASKAAVISYTQSAALAMAPHGIRVNGISPGVVDTPMWTQVDSLFAGAEGLALGEKKAAVGRAVPLGRMGLPADIAGAAVFLASAASSYITAQTLNVDGGNVMS